MKIVKQLSVVIILFGSAVGCATTSYKNFEHSENEVLAALSQTEDATLTRLKASASPDIADAARTVERDTVR